MWSTYDTFLLLAGLITAAIAVIPIPTIPAKTRAIAGVVGVGIVLLSLYLGSLWSFTYPAFVFAAPIVALLVAGVVVKSALDAKKQQDAAARGHHHGPQYGQTGHGTLRAPGPEPLPLAPAASPDDRAAAWADLFAPETTADRLAQIAGAHPEFAPQITAHPSCYPDLHQWAHRTIARQGGAA